LNGDEEEVEKMRKLKRKKLRKLGLLGKWLLLHLLQRGGARMLAMFLSHLALRKKSTRKSISSHGSRGLCWGVVQITKKLFPTEP
jgi:hypothetical protein